MKKIFSFSLLLILGLVASQILPGMLGESYPAFRAGATTFLYVCLSFIMINVGREFEIDKKRWRSYAEDYFGLGYHNDHVDELIEEAATCLDAGRLTEIYTELQEISAVDFPNIPVLYSQEVVASSSDITGYQATVYGLTGFTQVCWAG